MRAIRTTRIGGVLGVGLIVAASLAQPVSVSALAGLPLPLLDDVLAPVVQSGTPAVQSPSPSTMTLPQTDQPPTTTSEQPLADEGTKALQLAPPVITPVTPTPNNLKNPIALHWSAVDGADHYTYEYGTDPNFNIDTVSLDTTAVSVAPPAQADGTTYYWRVMAVPPTVSTSPFASDWSETNSFMIDTTPPSVTLPAPGTIKDGAQLMFTATDPTNGSGLATYNVSITDSKNTVVHQDGPITFPDQNGSYAYVWPGGLPNGQYTVSLTATDNAGNQAGPVMTTLELANDLPSTTATMGPNGQVATTTATLTISGQASANTSVVRIATTDGVKRADVTPNTDGTWDYTFGNLQAGIYQFDVTALDAAGNWGAVTTRVQATVVAYAPPVMTVISPDITEPLGRPSAFTPLTTIVPVTLEPTPDPAAAASIAAIAPDVSIDSTGKEAVPKDTSGQVLAASTSGWRFFGIGWQWWAIVVVAGGAGWWLLRNYRFRLVEADDL